MLDIVHKIFQECSKEDSSNLDHLKILEVYEDIYEIALDKNLLNREEIIQWALKAQEKLAAVLNKTTL